MKIILEFDNLQELKESLSDLTESISAKTEVPTIPSDSASNRAVPETTNPAVDTEVLPKQEPSKKKITVDDLSKMAVSLRDRGIEQDLLTDLLKKYHVKTVPDLATDHYDAFMADLKTLEATL